MDIWSELSGMKLCWLKIVIFKFIFKHVLLHTPKVKWTSLWFFCLRMLKNLIVSEHFLLTFLYYVKYFKLGVANHCQRQ